MHCRVWKAPSLPVIPCTTSRVLLSTRTDMINQPCVCGSRPCFYQDRKQSQSSRLVSRFCPRKISLRSSSICQSSHPCRPPRRQQLCPDYSASISDQCL